MSFRRLAHVASSLLVLGALEGCYATHVDVSRAADAPGRDAHIDVRAPSDVFPGPNDVPADAGGDAFCACSTDLDCPEPPPSWNCLVRWCERCMCGFLRDPALCGPSTRCDEAGTCHALDADAGPPDAGIDASEPVDAHRPASDAYAPPLDAFSVPRDASMIPVDARAPPLDAAIRPDAAPTSDALRFRATDVMTVPDRIALSLGPELTLEFWVRLRSGGVLAIKGDLTAAAHLYVEAAPPVGSTINRLSFGWTVGGARSVADAYSSIPVDVWTHFAFVQRATMRGRVEVQVFVDGELVLGPVDVGDASNYLASFNAAPFTLGRADMDLDEVRLWRVARGQAAIRSAMRSELPPGTSGLVAYWPLDGLGQVVLDRSLNGNDGFRGTSPAEDRADPQWIADGAF